MACFAELQKTKDARLKAQEARTQYLEHQAELKRQKMVNENFTTLQAVYTP